MCYFSLSRSAQLSHSSRELLSVFPPSETNPCIIACKSHFASLSHLIYERPVVSWDLVKNFICTPDQGNICFAHLTFVVGSVSEYAKEMVEEIPHGPH